MPSRPVHFVGSLGSSGISPDVRSTPRTVATRYLLYVLLLSVPLRIALVVRGWFRRGA